MAFQDDFSAFLSRSGVSLDAADAPTQDLLAEGLRKLSAFIGSLDVVTASALEEISADFPIKALLADPSVNIAPELGSVFRAFDQSNTVFSIANLVEVCKQPLGLPLPPSPPGVPTITAIEPNQPTFKVNEGNIVVRWSNTPADKYHFMWTDQGPPPPSVAGWNAVELNAENTTHFGFQIPNTFAGRKYTFKVQSCNVFDIGADACSGFSPTSTVVMPNNTRRLREFLRLSGVQLNPGIRSLGAAAFGAGIRVLMRL